MKCDKCDNEAKVSVKAILNGKEMDFNLCEDCLKKFTGSQIDEDGNLTGNIKNLDKKNIEKIISKFSPSLEDMIDSYYEFRYRKNTYDFNMIDSLSDHKCPRCGNLHSNIKNGQFGCPECYKLDPKLTFRILKTYNTYNTYKGRYPRRARDFKKIATKIKTLQEKLDRSVETEDYEQAKRIKEKIDELNTKVIN